MYCHGMLTGLPRHCWQLAATVAFVLAALLPASPAQAVSSQGTYTDWNWPATSEGYYNFDHDLRIQRVTPHATYFWSHQFGFVGGDGGYIGLQENGVGFNNYRGRLAIFSIWQATAASGPACGTFGGEGTGYSCKIPYQWVTNRRYRLRVWSMGSDSAGKWWGAWVMDRSTGVEDYIGSIRVPLPWGGLGSWSIMWTEYWSPITQCSDQPYANAIFYAPTANNLTVKPVSHLNHMTQGTGCTNGRITDLPNGVRQEMGL